MPGYFGKPTVYPFFFIPFYDRIRLIAMKEKGEEEGNEREDKEKENCKDKYENSRVGRQWRRGEII